MPSIESTKSSERVVETSRKREQSMELHTDDDVTPRASIDRDHDGSKIANAHQILYHEDAADRITRTSQDHYHASDAASTNYDAHSTIISTASLLSHDHDHVQRGASQQQTTTKGRKAFVTFCHALEYMYPIDINDDATSMSESSIGKLGKAVQERGRRMTGAGREKEVVAKTA